MFEIGKELLVHKEAQRLNVPAVGTYSASANLRLLMGLIFVGVGSSISMMGLEWIPIDKSKVHVPMEILVLSGVVFALPGLMLLFSGVKCRRAQMRIRELQASHPDRAWAWDGHWDGRVLTDRNGRPFWASIIGIAFLLCFAGAFHSVGFIDERAPSLFRYASIFIDLGLLIACFVFVRTLLRIARHGRGKIELSDMPIRPGQPCRLQFTLDSDLSLFDSLRLDLAFVEERVVESGSGNNRSRHLIAESRLRETKEFELAGSAGSMQRSLILTIQVPEGSPATQLSSHPSKSWQLGVHLETLGLDYKGRFLLPVYRIARDSSTQPISIRADTQPLSVS